MMFFFFGGELGLLLLLSQTNHQPLALVYRRGMMTNILQIVQTAAFITRCSIWPFECLGHNHLQKQEYLTSIKHE